MSACRKRRYHSRIGAQLALADIGRKAHKRPKEESRAYRCPSCHGWHLTSMKRQA